MDINKLNTAEDERTKNRNRKRKYRQITNEVLNQIEAVKRKFSRYETNSVGECIITPNLSSTNNQEAYQESYQEDFNLPSAEIEQENLTADSDIDEHNAEMENVTTELDDEKSFDDEDFKFLLESQESVTEEDKLRHWAIDNNIKYSALDELLLILKQSVLPDLPKSSRTLLDIEYNFTIKTVVTDSGQTISYAYFGLEQSLKDTVNPLLHQSGQIDVQINVDGMSVFKSNNQQFWPILGKICNEQDLYEPFVIGILLSDGKPQHTCQYLNEFVEDFNRISENGLKIDDCVYKVCLKCFICDTPARCFLKYTKGHGGFGACERCTDRGTRVNNRTVYPNSAALKRTDESFRARQDSDHHIGVTPLLQLNPKIDMVKSFILDYMHLACNGVTLKLLWEFWINGKRRIRLSRKEQQEFSRRLISLKKFIPTEFQRKPRSAKCANKWKATELRLFLLYCGPLVLRQLLREELYEHFLLLHTAFRILCSDEYKTKGQRAKLFLNRFFRAAPILSGKQVCILNMHNLLHVADDTVNMNCNLSKISAFPFENCLGELRNLVRTPNNPLAQVCRGIQEIKKYQNKVPIAPPKFQILKSVVFDGVINIKKLKFKNYFELTTQRPNNCVLTHDNRILFIKKIFCFMQDPANIQVEGLVFKKIRSAYKYPFKSSKLNIWEVSITENKLVVSLDLLKNKLVCLSLKLKQTRGYKHFVLPFLH